MKTINIKSATLILVMGNLYCQQKKLYNLLDCKKDHLTDIYRKQLRELNAAIKELEFYNSPVL